MEDFPTTCCALTIVKVGYFSTAEAIRDYVSKFIGMQTTIAIVTSPDDDPFLEEEVSKAGFTHAWTLPRIYPAHEGYCKLWLREVEDPNPLYVRNDRKYTSHPAIQANLLELRK